MFAPKARSPVRDTGRMTFMDSVGGKSKPTDRSLSNTASLSHTAKLGTTMGKREQLAQTLEENLVRRYGGTPAADGIIHNEASYTQASTSSGRDIFRRQVSATVLSGTRITPEAIKLLTEKLAAMHTRGWAVE
jgi:hypothetical protein